MYAVVKTGGKQYQVKPGDVIWVEDLAQDKGATVTFDQVLLVNAGDSVTVGKPVIEGAKVSGTVVETGLGKKVTVFKFQRRKDYRRKNGHRQKQTGVRIDSIG